MIVSFLSAVYVHVRVTFHVSRKLELITPRINLLLVIYEYLIEEWGGQYLNRLWV